MNELSPEEMELLAGAQRRIRAARQSWLLPEESIGQILARGSMQAGVGVKKVRHWDRLTVGAGALTILLLITAVILPNIRGVLSRNSNEFSSRVYTTKRGERAAVTLGDGTRIILAPATTIKVNKSYVDLSGEALFTVVNNAKTPFVVHVGNSIARVLGTTFGIRAYPDHPSVYIAVSDGRVSVEPVGKKGNIARAVLSAGDLAVATDNGRVSITHNAERVLEMLAFGQGRLVIDGESLEQAAMQISRWLNVDVRVDKSVASRPF